MKNQFTKTKITLFTFCILFLLSTFNVYSSPRSILIEPTAKTKKQQRIEDKLEGKSKRLEKKIKKSTSEKQKDKKKIKILVFGLLLALLGALLLVGITEAGLITGLAILSIIQISSGVTLLILGVVTIVKNLLIDG